LSLKPYAVYPCNRKCHQSQNRFLQLLSERPPLHYNQNWNRAIIKVPNIDIPTSKNSNKTCYLFEFLNRL
jgi:hypothetical protein